MNTIANNVKYKNLEKARAEDEELERLEAEYIKANDPDAVVAPASPEPPKDEDKTWEVRYANLRSFSQKQINEVKREKEQEVNDLKKRIADLEKSSQRMPENEAELDSWVKDYPDLARVLMGLMRKQAREETDTVRADLEALRNERQEETLALQREAAVRKVVATHPDFFDLIETDDFKEWVNSQPEVRGPKIGQALHDALYNNETDADAAIQAVNIYKMDKGVTTKPERKRKEIVEAASSVRRTNSGNPQSENGKPTFSESQIERMSLREYEKVEDDIDLAKREGRFVYDITGAAR